MGEIKEIYKFPCGLEIISYAKGLLWREGEPDNMTSSHTLKSGVSNGGKKDG